MANHQDDLRDAHVLVIGTGAMGVATAQRALDAGAQVTLAGRSGDRLAKVAGSSGRRPLAGFGIWGTLHGSLEALALNAAVELSPIRVNVVSPGGIGIRMDRQLVQHAGVPDDIARMVCALMANPAVTSAVVDVDGGERLGAYPSPANAWAS